MAPFVVRVQVLGLRGLGFFFWVRARTSGFRGFGLGGFRGLLRFRELGFEVQGF